MFKSRLARRSAASPRIVSLALLLGLAVSLPASQAAAQSILKRLEAPNERIELTVNSSRILTLDLKFKRAQVNNPEILAVNPLASNQLQVSAKAPGVTQMNVWDENDRIYSLDVIIYGDARELELALQTQFPEASVKVYRYSNSLMLTGFVDEPDQVSRMMRLAEDYAPKVINNIRVAGVQQIMLDVRVMEVSRTKLRKLGVDFANFNGNDFIVSSISGLISTASSSAQTVATTGGETVAFGILDGSNAFFGVIEALQQHNLMKILAKPKLTTVSGRPASFNVGGEFPVIVPQSLGTVSIEYKKFGTQVDFMPLVLGNGNIRLEVRPRVSEIDSTRSVVVNEFTVPGLRVREVDTAVEMKAGQTLALAGLIQNRVESQSRGLPWISEVPYAGVLFRSVREEVNEIELLIMVTPQFVDAMDPHEVPRCGPGMRTRRPTDGELYLRGRLEMPRCGGCDDCECQDCGGAGAHGMPMEGYQSFPVEEVAPPMQQDAPLPPQARSGSRGARATPASSRRGVSVTRAPMSQPVVTMPAPTAQPQQQPSTQQAYSCYLQDRYNTNPQTARRAAAGPQPPGMIGPIGYDVR
jgi:pilus assembly protein CpaC